MERDCSHCEWVSVVINIFAALLIGGGLIFAALQTQAQANALRTASYVAVMDKQLEINKIFLEKPYLQPYFFDGVAISENTASCEVSVERKEDCFRQSLALSDYYLDFFDLFYSQREVILQSRKDCEAWEYYIVDRLRNSPILQERVTTAEKNKWYTTDFTENLKLKFQKSLSAENLNEECGSFAKH